MARGLACDLVVNVQGDLPLLDPRMIEVLAARMADDPTLPMATARRADRRRGGVGLAARRQGGDRRRRGRALYFSRSPIPFDRDGTRRADEPFGRRHIGMYAYRRDVLLRLAALPPSPLERREKLEQLRALEHGIAIGVVAWTDPRPLVEVDTADDLEQARAALAADDGPAR